MDATPQEITARPESLLRQLGRVGRGCTCFHLRKAARAVTQLYDEILRPSGLRGTQFTLLTAIRLQQPVPVHQLADSMVMDRTTLTRNLRPLERQGFIVITPGESDRRRRDVSLTDDGAETLATALPLWREAQKIVEDSLGDERLKSLLGDLRATVDAARE